MKFMHLAPFCSLSLLVACGGGAAAGPTPGPTTVQPPTTSLEPTSFAEQVTVGQKLYGEHCASCHGAGGEGSKGAPRVVDLKQGALPLDPPAGAKGRTSKFVTVADVATFVVKNMPPGRPASLGESNYYSILAFDLKANGIVLDKKLDGPLAASLKIPR